MGRSRAWWYGVVKHMIRMYPKLTSEQSSQAKLYVEAIEESMSALDESWKAQAVSMIWFHKTHTIYGVAYKLHYSVRTIQRVLSSFVYDVGKRVGF